jgi:hypothetical protein
MSAIVSVTSGSSRLALLAQVYCCLMSHESLTEGNG